MSNADAAVTSRTHHEVDISSWNFWMQTFAERDRSFALLRREPSLTWHAPMDTGFPHGEEGFWAATRQEDISTISKNHEVFSSARGWTVDPLSPGIDVNSVAFFLAMDPPEHGVYRRLISAAFTPRQVAKLQEKIEQGAREIVQDLVGAGDLDFVSACSTRLPVRTVMDMIGIAEADREAVAKAAEVMFSAEDPEVLQGVEDPIGFMQAQIELLHSAAIKVAQDRRKNPRDDLITNIVQAEVDGHRLTDEQIGAFMVLLSTAGTDTTKQTTSHTIWALSQFPDQRKWLAESYDERIGLAIEEFVRFASPVLAFARVALEDTEVHGAQIRTGDRVGLFYCSGNRDESVFERPDELVLSRKPNPHVAFGGGGVHYCLGNHVAKIQLRALFRELILHAPGLEVGDPVWLTSRHMHAIKRLPATFPA